MSCRIFMSIKTHILLFMMGKSTMVVLMEALPHVA